MSFLPSTDSKKLVGVVFAVGEQPVFQPGDAVRILTRSPVVPVTTRETRNVQ